MCAPRTEWVGSALGESDERDTYVDATSAPG